MKIYMFAGNFPYKAIICANSAGDAKTIYAAEVSDLGADCVDELPCEIDKTDAAEYMVNIPEETGFDTIEEYVDDALHVGVPCVLGMDGALR